jgi:DNA-binding NarL/FixJ family response regulator
VIADDSVLVRASIASLLRDDTWIDVAAQVLNAEELLREVDDHRPDVAIVDIRMPPDHAQEGILAAHELRERHPGVGIVILSSTSTSGRRPLARGASGLPAQGPPRPGQLRRCKSMPS